MNDQERDLHEGPLEDEEQAAGEPRPEAEAQPELEGRREADAQADEADQPDDEDTELADEDENAQPSDEDADAELSDEDEADSEDQPAIATENVDAPGAAEPMDAPEAADVPVARRRSRRTASRPAGPPPAMFSAAPEPHPGPVEAPIGRPSVAMVAAVFQAPEIVVAPPRPPRDEVLDEDVDLEADVEALSDDDTTLDADAEAEGAQASDAEEASRARRRRRRGGRGRGRRTDGGEDGGEGPAEGSSETPEDAAEGDQPDTAEAGPEAEGEAEAIEDEPGEGEGGSSRRRRRRRSRSKAGADGEAEPAAKPAAERRTNVDEVTAVKGSTRLEAKKQRRREGRASRGTRAPILTEAEFLARRESVDRQMVVRQRGGLTQIGVLEDDVLVEHYVASESSNSMIGNVYLGRVQNVLPSMEAAFVDIGRGRNAVLYAGEVNWDAAGLEGQPKRIELALKSGDTVLVQVTKDPVGHKGARLTSQISLPGRFLVYVPAGGMTGISRKLPDRERTRLKKILRAVVPDDAGVIVRTAAEGASEEQLAQDVERLQAEWERISQAKAKAAAPSLLRSEPDLTLKVARDIFNEDFTSMVVSGDRAYASVQSYVEAVAPDLAPRVSKWVTNEDVFAAHRIDEQLAKALDRKVWLPSGGSLVIDHTEAMTVIDVNTGKFIGQGGNLEETVTRNNLEAAEEIVRQLRLRDLGGIIVVDFIDMVLESNRDLVVRRLVECLSRDRTKHQVAEVTSLGLVQMTRKRIGQGLMETFSTPCETCHGRGAKVQTEPVGQTGADRNAGSGGGGASTSSRRRGKAAGPIPGAPTQHKAPEAPQPAAHDEHEPHDAHEDHDEPAVHEDHDEAAVHGDHDGHDGHEAVEPAATIEAVEPAAEPVAEPEGAATPQEPLADGAVD